MILNAIVTTIIIVILVFALCIFIGFIGDKYITKKNTGNTVSVGDGKKQVSASKVSNTQPSPNRTSNNQPSFSQTQNANMQSGFGGNQFAQPQQRSQNQQPVAQSNQYQVPNQAPSFVNNQPAFNNQNFNSNNAANSALKNDFDASGFSKPFASQNANVGAQPSTPEPFFNNSWAPGTQTNGLNNQGFQPSSFGNNQTPQSSFANNSNGVNGMQNGTLQQPQSGFNNFNPNNFSNNNNNNMNG